MNHCPRSQVPAARGTTPPLNNFAANFPRREAMNASQAHHLVSTDQALARTDSHLKMLTHCARALCEKHAAGCRTTKAVTHPRLAQMRACRLSSSNNWPSRGRQTSLATHHGIKPLHSTRHNGSSSAPANKLRKKQATTNSAFVLKLLQSTCQISTRLGNAFTWELEWLPTFL